MSAVQEALTSLGLRGWSGPATLDRDATDELLSTVSHDGLVPLLNAAVDAGLVAVPDDIVDALHARWQDEMASVVSLDGLLVRVTSVLRSAGIPTRVLKGAALAMLDELSPPWRRYGDVDLLVPSDSLLAAADVVATLGFRADIEPVSARWAAHHAKGLTMVDEHGIELDLHRQLAAGPLGSRVRSACLFEQGRPFTLGGRPLVALGDLHRFLHACYHAVLGGFSGPRHVRDIALTARHVEPGDLLAQRSDGWSPTVVAIAVRDAADQGAACPPAWIAWAQDWTDDPHDARLVRAYEGSFQDLARVELAELRHPMAKLRYVARLVLPSRAHLATRGESRRHRWQRLAAAALHRKRTR